MSMGGNPGSASLALREAVRRFGPGLASEPAQLRAVLGDLAPPTGATERAALDALVETARSGVAAELVVGRARPAGIEQRLAALTGLTPEWATWCVDTWCAALGIGSGLTGPATTPLRPGPTTSAVDPRDRAGQRDATGRSGTRIALVVGAALSVAALVGVVAVLRLGGDNGAGDDPDTEAPPSVSNSDHWHTAYGVHVCDTFQEPIPDQGTDPVGIHTHGDGVIHIHPFSEASSGDNAQLYHFTDLVGIDFDGDAITLPDGTTKTNGDDCNGEPGTWKLLWWPADDLGAEAIVRTDIDSFGDFRFPEDRGALTLAFVPDSTDVNGLRPPTVGELDSLSDVANDPDAGGDSSSTVPGSTVPRTATTVASAADVPCVAATGVPPVAGKPEVPTPVGPPPEQLVVEDLVVGDGPSVFPDDEVTVHYVGVACSTGEQFDASWDRGTPVTFTLDQVIEGWQLGLVGMQPGGRRLLVIPPRLAYGDDGQPPDIAPGETLVFVVDLLTVG
jgi:peptidylprolyl isomerase